MAADHDGAAALGERRMQILEAMDLGELVHAAVAAPPGIGRLAESHPQALAVAVDPIRTVARPKGGPAAVYVSARDPHKSHRAAPWSPSPDPTHMTLPPQSPSHR